MRNKLYSVKVYLKINHVQLFYNVKMCRVNIYKTTLFQIAKFEETLKEKNDLLTCFKGSKVRG